MNSEMINEMKEIYKNNYLHSEDGKKALFHACRLRKEALDALKNGCDFNNTARVKMNLLGKKINSKTQLVSITPIGLNSMCHSNARVFTKYCGFETVLGWNITACRCGCRMGFELHSLNKKDGVLYDFTKDMCNETEKYFVELDTDVRPESYMDRHGCPEIFFINKGCKCRMKSKLTYGGCELLTEDDVLDLIDFLEDY